MLLAGDIGGTKTNLAVFSPEGGSRAPIAKATFPSGKYSSLEVLAQEFLQTVDARIDRASFGVAGPVVEGRAKITNLPWVMEEKRLQDELNLSSVSLLNDLEAIAYSVTALEPSDVRTLHPGRPVKGGPIAVVAPGTGLGEAFLTWDGAGYRVHSSEGGHADFAPTDEMQIELLRYLFGREKHVSYERVCSGRGLPNIYRFLRDTCRCEEPAWLAEKLAGVGDPAPIIVNTALDQTHPAEICTLTVETFVAILGAEAGNMALKVMASGGVYLGGGIPPRILEIIERGRFIQAFQSKGRFVEVLNDMPVHVILNPEVALFGAACHGLENL